MDIYVISLNRSTDRKDEFDKHNSHVKYTYHEAVDGNTYTPGPDIVEPGIQYKKGVIGCAVSHLQLWNKCIEMDKPIIIMEDDAILHKEFNDHIDKIKDLLPEEWDIVLLNFNFDSILTFKVLQNYHCTFAKSKINIDEFVHSKINTTIAKLINVFGVAAYMIHPNGAKRFKDSCFPMNHTVLQLPYINKVPCYTLDMMMNTVYKDMNSYVCIFPIVMTLHGQEGYKSVAFD